MTQNARNLRGWGALLLLAVALVAACGHSRRPSRGGTCLPAVGAWARRCAASSGLTISEQVCPNDHLIVLSAAVGGAAPLRVEVARAPRRGFRSVGAWSLSPVGEFPSWERAPAPLREAFDRVTACVRAAPALPDRLHQESGPERPAAPATAVQRPEGRGPDARIAAPGLERRVFSSSVLALLTDGILLSIAGLAFVLLLVRRQLREAPAGAGWALAGVVLAGALLRLVIAREAPMTAWSYARIVPLAAHAYWGHALPAISRATGATVHLAETIHHSVFLLAAAAPLVMFAHAHYVLKDWRSALAAAAILALLPLHIRFSHGDVEIVQSLLTSSLTFVVLYCAIMDPSPAWRWACFLALPLLCVATYTARPEAIVFYPLDLGGILIASGAATRPRRALAAALATGAAAFSVSTYLLVQHRHNISQGLTPQTLRTALATLFSPRLNMLLNPWSTAPVLTVLAVVGGVALWRRGEARRVAFLLCWLLGFFVVHSYVTPTALAMQARYHLNLATPFVLLAAAATPALLVAPRWARWGALAYLAAMPLLHLRFERDADYFEMREYEFLRSVRGRVPAGCTVLEFRPATNVATPEARHASRLERVAGRIERGVAGAAWRIVSLGALAPGQRGPDAHETLTPEAAEVLRRPPPCLMFYEGLTCWSHRPRSSPLAPVCAALHGAADLDPVAVTRFRSHVYDAVNVGRTVYDASGAMHSAAALHDGSEVTLSLYRLRGPARLP